MRQRPSPLRVRRFLRGLRLRDVADAVGAHETLISEIERGDSPLRGRVLHALANFYTTPSDRLLFEHERWQRSDHRSVPTRPPAPCGDTP
jgi:transcriptional regulator with XRE-family HTH domain